MDPRMAYMQQLYSGGGGQGGVGGGVGAAYMGMQGMRPGGMPQQMGGPRQFNPGSVPQQAMMPGMGMRGQGRPMPRPMFRQPGGGVVLQQPGMQGQLHQLQQAGGYGGYGQQARPGQQMAQRPMY